MTEVFKRKWECLWCFLQCFVWKVHSLLSDCWLFNCRSIIKMEDHDSNSYWLRATNYIVILLLGWLEMEQKNNSRTLRIIWNIFSHNKLWCKILQKMYSDFFFTFVLSLRKLMNLLLPFEPLKHLWQFKFILCHGRLMKGNGRCFHVASWKTIFSPVF